MRLRTFVAAALALAAAPIAWAQQYPQIVLDRTKMMAATCTSLGGKPGQGDRPFTYQTDLNGDGKQEWLLDSAGFGCVGKPNAFRSPQGAALEIFAQDSRGAYKSAYIGTIFTYRITNKPAKLFATFKGSACGGANATCEKQLVWNASSRKFTPGAAALASGPASPQTGATSAGGAFSGPAFAITAADKTAAFKAAGFKQTKRGWQLCADSEGADSLSYTPGEITETPDLNGDGRPEIWIREGGAMCYGNSGGMNIFLAKTSAGAWKVIFNQITDPTILSTRTNGWRDIQDGGPGMGPWGKARFTGTEYGPFKR